MTRKLNLGMAALVVFGVMTTARAAEPVEIEQVSTMNISTQFASMRAELESLRAKQADFDELRARFEQVSFGGEVGCDDCGAGYGCNCFCNIGCGGIYGGVEAVVVRPHFEHEITRIGPQLEPPDGAQIDPSFDFSVSPRIFLGWRNCRGTGIRARYWYYDQTADLANVGDFDLLRSGLTVQALDLEFTQLVCLGPVNTNFALGVRYASVENVLEFSIEEENAKLRNQFDGWGPTIAMENRIPLGCSNVSVVGNLRGSLLFGDTHVTVAGDDSGETIDEATFIDGRQDVVAVAELQVGLQWSRCTNYGVFSAYALLEGQYWAGAASDFAPGVEEFSVTATDSDLGFVGGTFGIQLAR
jgi:hypothetical protein